MTLVQFSRFIDGTIINKNTKKTALECLETIQLIINNLIQYPDMEKYRSIRGRGKMIQKVLSLEGGEELLIILGATKTVKEFEAFYTFPTHHSELETKLKSYIEIISKFIVTIVESMAIKVDPKLEEMLYKEKILKDIELDRIARLERQSEKRLKGTDHSLIESKPVDGSLNLDHVKTD
ncbi:hypothetical protein HDV02_001179 [Globomyces sp. JEL0801]|nr:hypothetical protein HDV02_001179 [Globomyces sp. JEL0801]